MQMIIWTIIIESLIYHGRSVRPLFPRWLRKIYVLEKIAQSDCTNEMLHSITNRFGGVFIV